MKEIPNYLSEDIMNGCVKKEVVMTEKAKAIGPYSLGIKVGDFVFCSGQAGVDQATGKLVEGGIGEATKQCVANVRALLESHGARLDQVVKTTVFLTDMADYPAMNDAYLQAFAGHRPARSAVAVAALPLGARVEIEAWAFVG